MPSFEVGAGAIHLVDSHTWAANLYGKIALNEGYHDLPLPSLAVRGAVSRMITQDQLDLTIASIDVSISKHFGVAGTWRLDPFLGVNLLMILPQSEVLDGTPNIDQLQPGNASDGLNTFTFDDQSTIYRERVFVGAKFQYYIFHLTLEAQFARQGSSSDSQPGATDACTPTSMTDVVQREGRRRLAAHALVVGRLRLLVALEVTGRAPGRSDPYTRCRR